MYYCLHYIPSSLSISSNPTVKHSPLTKMDKRATLVDIPMVTNEYLDATASALYVVIYTQ